MWLPPCLSPQGPSTQEQSSERPSLYTAEQYPTHRHVVSAFQFVNHTAVNARVQASLPALERVHFGVELGALGVLWLLTEAAGFPSVSWV